MNWLRPTEEKMQTILEHLHDALGQIRTGRAQVSLLDDVKASYYGTMTPLKGMASITVQGNQLLVQPFDRNSLGDIELAIRNSELGLNPINDGALIRIALPPMTEERRAQMVKLTHDRGEEARIALRSVRKESWEDVQERVKKSELTQDDLYRGEEELNKLIDRYNHEVAQAIEQKVKELTTLSS